MLFLTATCTNAIRKEFESLMDLQINLLHWPSSSNIMHRSVSVHTQYTSKPFQYVMNTFKSMISESSAFIKNNSDSDPNGSNTTLPTKVIVYSNTRCE